LEFHLSESLIQIADLSFSHGDRLLYDNISLTIPRGKITAFMGPSGIGKTTLLRLIGGQLRPDSGKVLFDGIDVPTLPRQELYQLRKRMSMLFQSGALFTGLNVFDNVAFPLREHTTLPEELIRTLVLMKLECVGLRGAAQLMPSNYLAVWPDGLRWREPLHWIRNSSCMMSPSPDRIPSPWRCWSN